MSDVRDTVVGWFVEHRLSRETEARALRKLYDRLKDKDSTYGRAHSALLNAHMNAAAAYLDAQIEFERELDALKAKEPKT